MEYRCPLCNQPVSLKTYKDITGIWEERERLLAKVAQQRARLAEKEKEFRKQKNRLIKQAVKKSTKPMEIRLRTLKQRGERLEKEARLRLRRVAAQARKSEGAVRDRLLRQMRKHEGNFAQEIKKERLRLRREKARLHNERTRLVQEAIRKQTERLESQRKNLRFKEQQIEKAALRRIEKATALAHRRAERVANSRLKALHRSLRVSLNEQLKKQESNARDDVRLIEEKYQRLNRNFQHAMKDARAKDSRLREQARRYLLFKKELRQSLRNKLKDAKNLGAQQIRSRYDRLERTFRSTLSQMTIKDRELRTRAEQIKELRRELERQTTPQMEGLLNEDNLTRQLKRRFPADKFIQTRKGGDILQSIMRKGEQVGVMIYECKRVKRYSSSHVRQASEAKEKRNADFAILVTNSMKKGTQGFFAEQGVMVVHVAGVLSLATVLREQVIRIAELKLGQLERRKAVKLVLEYLEGPDFTNSLDAIIGETITLYNDLKDDVKKHVNSWKKRYDSYRKVHEQAFAVKSISRSLLSGEPRPQELKGEVLPALPEMPKVEKETADPASET